MTSGLVHTLADRLLAIDYPDAPEAVREKVRTALLYNLAMGLAGRSAGKQADDALRALHAGPGPALVLGAGFQRAAPDAAFLNAALITARGQNDTYPALVAHVGCVVIPAALAASALGPCSGARFLTGVLRGYEAIGRLGQDVAAQANRRGFRSTSVISVFGAAAASAGVLGLSAQQTADALAIAANFSGGLLQCWADGSDEWRLQIGNASRLGLMAALYARGGFRGAKGALDGENGWYRAFSGTVPELDLESWSIPALTFKPYPGCAFNQVSVHMLRALVARERLDASRIAGVVVEMNPLDAAYPGVGAYGPFDTQSGAIMSGPYMLAATLRDGAPAQRHFAESHREDALHARSRDVEIRPAPDVDRWRCRLHVTTEDGSSLAIATGTEEPFAFGWDEMLSVLEPVIADWDESEPETRFSSLVDAVRQLQDAPDMGRLDAAIGLPAHAVPH